MKKIAIFVTFICLIISGFFVNSCNQNDDLTSVNDKNIKISDDLDLNLRTWPTVIFKFKHRGRLASRCDVGVCGTCFGICFIIRFMTWDAANLSGEQNLGEVYSNVDMSNEILTLIPLSTVDDGSGEIIVLNDEVIDSTFAAAMGYSSGAFTVKVGEYTIDYSTYTYGEIDFDIE